ncbi:chromosome segregation protein SMC [soil metagenome]
MTAPARLRALRLVGFKSFAERTLVEFGPGISAVVGPNGSGKSNLADALRWTLGEQGRLLRTRRSEDVIFAGSSSRRAIGMADVTLVIDNDDRLLPLDYGEVEIGRRLYRSGENEYLLNRQRIRLRDLSELLDAANLADNAFLFIGQGMVDQALALRPEERRPLFEEVAGVRRHERRRRHAEAELSEAESNLERVRDVLAELRPQVRRLAAQAEQLQARRSAGLELAEALVAAAKARWVESWRSAQIEQRALAEAHLRSDGEMAALRLAEESSERHSRSLFERAAREQELRSELDARRAATTELRLTQARQQSEMAAVQRERNRLEQERGSLEQRLLESRQQLAQPRREADLGLARLLAQAERDLAELEAQLAGTVDGSRASEQEELRRSALAAELEQLLGRDAKARRETAAEAQALTVLATRLAEQQAERDEAVARLNRARDAAAAAAEALQTARSELERCAARRTEIGREEARLEAEAAAAGAGLAALEGSAAARDNSTLLRAARARGGTLVAEGLEVDPSLRRAVSAALGESLQGLAVEAQAVASLRDQKGVLFVRSEVPTRSASGASVQAAKVEAAAIALGGDLLKTALRRDPQGFGMRLLERCLWVPELDEALSLRPLLPVGWRVVTRAGEVLDDQGLLRLSDTESELEQRALRDERTRQLADLKGQLSALTAEAKRAESEQAAASSLWQRARTAEERARGELHAAEEAERAAQRRAETSLREASWSRTQQQRAQQEAQSLSRAIEQAEAALTTYSPASAPTPARVGRSSPPRAGQLERRLELLRKRRDQLAAQAMQEEEKQRAAEEARRRTEIALALAEPRSAEIDAELERIAARSAQHTGEAERLGADLVAAQEREQRTASELAALRREEEQDRRGLQAAERSSTEARERLRRAEARSRTAEVAVMEARLQLEQVREQLLIELAAIGRDGLAALLAVEEAGGSLDDDGPGGPADEISPDGLGAELESALEAAIGQWSAAERADQAPPAAGRLAALRRQFNTLGAGNPFAAEEYAEVRARLEEMEAQRDDLETAMVNTRQLIANLSKLITDQFLATFAALEGAFARRFEQLFGGGEAQLSLTLPHDLSATGVEITARPPGKKRQPLAMLSGGERALTAVALLLAMLEVRPVPFCVLDEVDAALDEANISRFSAALRGLADRIQFVVITHNRGTIEAADALYGVTLGEDAVSRIVSLRLPPPVADQAQAAVELPTDAPSVPAEMTSA